MDASSVFGDGAYVGSPRTFVAPGKLVLLGEYAVLDGGGAIVAAVDRGVVCVVSTGAGIETPGDDRFVRAALTGAPRGLYRFRDQYPLDLPGKAGFGGSAAATVAAIRAAGRPDADAFTVHASVQGGGSGVDVFASVNGGVRAYPSGRSVACPPFLVVWSGQSAATGPRIQQYLAWADRVDFVVRSRELVDAFEDDPLGVTGAAYALLQEMSHRAGIDYDLPAFQRIASLTQAVGGAAKPSGAGGGDIAVAIVPDVEKRETLRRLVAEEGFFVIDVGISPKQR